VSLAYFPLYPDRYEADTAHLSILEDGAYNRLLRLCWRCPQCKMPDDDAWIYRQMRANSSTEKAAVDRVLAEFFKRGKGKVWSPKLLEIHAQVSVAHSSKSEAGKRGAAAKALKKKEAEASTAKATLKQPEPEPEPERKSSEAIASGDFAADPVKAIFDAGVQVLTGAGLSDRQARAFVGKLRKDHPDQDGQILGAIMDCGRAGAVDPIPWITAALHKPKTPTAAEIMARISEDRPQ